MELILARDYNFLVLLKDDKDAAFTLTVYVESRNGRLDTITGQIIPFTDLDESVN